MSIARAEKGAKSIISRKASSTTVQREFLISLRLNNLYVGVADALEEGGWKPLLQRQNLPPQVTKPRVREDGLRFYAANLIRQVSPQTIRYASHIYKSNKPFEAYPLALAG